MPIPKTPVTKEKALEKLASLCSRAEQCEFELNRKMINWKISFLERKEIIEYLIENRYLDDARYARCYANDKARFTAWGPSKIKGELIRRRINSSLIHDALQNVDPRVWKEGLLRCAESKAKNLDLIGEEGMENRYKLYRYLLSRGFSSSSSSKAVNLMKKKQEEMENE